MKEYQKYLTEVFEGNQGPTDYPEGLEGLEVRYVGKDTEEHEDDGYSLDITTYTFSINLNGNKIGELKYTDYFGNISGNIGGRPLYDLKKYDKYVDFKKLGNKEGDFTEEGLEYYMETILKYFFSTKTGQKWLDIARRKGNI